VPGIHVDANSAANTIWTNTAEGNGVYDLADEHPDSTCNNWGLPPEPPSDSNSYGTSYFNQGPF